ncbi:DUF4190 domain-containing protein [Streptomyces sp. NPDC007100]|uniref:DUF4190 domain-containing protein n=1 Tax=Streptomyces sp. NPDC007100 TaxID=3155602 RepID=UPI003405950A
MTVSTPPGDQKPEDQAPGDRNPWSPPPAGAAPADPAAYPAAPVWAPQPQPRNGLGISALVLGIVGILLGMFIILFWLSWLPAVLALVFGFIGLSRARKDQVSNRGLALAGVILGGIGLLTAIGGGIFTVVAVKKAADDVRAGVEEVKSSAAAEAEKEKKEKAAEAAEENARHITFGRTYTFEKGLKVTVAKPETFIPDSMVFGHAKGNKAIQVTVTVVNTSSERIKTEPGLPTVKDAKGTSAELVIDGSGRQKLISGSVEPGKTVVGKYAFSLPPDAADSAEVEFNPNVGDFDFDDVYWSGPLNLS